MKRAWASTNVAADDAGVLHRNPQNGTDEAFQLGQALAAIADPDFIRSVINVKAALDQFGGQYVLAAKRVKVNGNGQIDDAGAERVTIAYAHSYQHVADAIRGEREPDSRPDRIDFGENGDEPEQPPVDEPAPEEAIADGPPLSEEELDAALDDPGEQDYHAEREAAELAGP